MAISILKAELLIVFLAFWLSDECFSDGSFGRDEDSDG